MEDLLENLKEDRLQRNGGEGEDVRAYSSSESSVNRGVVAEMFVSHMETMKILQVKQGCRLCPEVEWSYQLHNQVSHWLCATVGQGY